MSRYGIIDLGSNTIRLCIYEVSCAAHEPLRKKDIDTLLNYKVMAGLASHVEEGAMTEEGIKRAIKTINAHLRRASHFKCDRIDIFATAVLRNCSNSHKATAAIERARQRICSLQRRRGTSCYLGAKLDQDLEEGTMVDIGGGSTELTSIKGGFDLAKTSIPQGSLSSFANYVAGLMPTQKEVNAITQAFRELAEKEETDVYHCTQAFLALPLYPICPPSSMAICATTATASITCCPNTSMPS